MDKDFSIEFPEMASMPSLLIPDHNKGTQMRQQVQDENQEIREKYFSLLDKHNLLLEANISLREENIRLKEEIALLIQRGGS